MSFNFFVYDMGIVDFYSGMMMLKDYIKFFAVPDEKLEKSANYMGSTYLSFKDLKTFLIKCFLEVKTCESYWEGDIRGLNEIAISAIPMPTGGEPSKILVFKQDNNGHSFMVSETCLDIKIFKDYHDVERLNKIKDFDKRDLFLWFDQSYDLTERLFEYALRDVIPFVIPKTNIIKEVEPTTDSINMSDFEKIG